MKNEIESFKLFNKQNSLINCSMKLLITRKGGGVKEKVTKTYIHTYI